MINSEDFNASSPVVSVPVNPPTTPNDQTKPLILNNRPIGLSILLILLIGSILYKTITSMVAIAVMSKSVTLSHILLPIFSIAPSLCVFPVIGAITAIFLLYLFLKTRDMSVGSYKLLQISLIIVPLLYTLLIFLLLTQRQTVYLATDLGTNSLPQNPLTPVFSAILNEINLFSLVALLVVKKKKNLFTNPPLSLSWLQKIILVVLGLIIFLPAFSETFTVIRNSLYPDTKYNQVRSEVGHKIYTPSSLPQGLEIVSEYYIDDKNSLKLPNATVRVGFDIPFDKKLNGTESEVVVMNQSLVTEDFNLANYINNQHPGISPGEEKLEIASNGMGYTVIQPLKGNEKIQIKYLYLVTSDNIFVSLTAISPQISVQNLIEIANSLK